MQNELQQDEKPFPWNLVFAGLSLAGCSSNIFLATILRKWREGLGKMVITLAIFQVLIFLPWFLPEEISQAAYMAYLFGWGSSLPLTCCFGYGLLIRVKHKQNRSERLNQLFCRFFIISVSFGILFSFQAMINLYPFALNIISLVFRGAMVIGCIAVCLNAYIVVLKLRKKYELTTQYEGVLLVYPFIMILTILPWILCLLYTMLILGQDYFPSDIGNVMSCVTSSPGFLNAIAYVLTKNVRESIAKTCCRRNRNNRNGESTDLTESLIGHDNNHSQITKNAISLPDYMVKSEDK